MRLITDTISITELERMASKMFNHLVKAVVDINQGIMVVDAELHADQETFLLEHGSEQEHLWGINLHPAKFGLEDFIEFDSMINLRPSWGNVSRGVEDERVQQQIIAIVSRLVVA